MLLGECEMKNRSEIMPGNYDVVWYNVANIRFYLLLLFSLCRAPSTERSRSIIINILLSGSPTNLFVAFSNVLLFFFASCSFFLVVQFVYIFWSVARKTAQQISFHVNKSSFAINQKVLNECSTTKHKNNAK